MKIGRNDPCPCGSGKKYKACCGAGGNPNAVHIDRRHLLALFHAGHFAPLEDQLDHLLRQNPQSAFLWGLLGTTRQMLGEDGLPALQKAVALAPDDAETHCNLGTAWHGQGRIDEAETCYRKATALDPRHLRAHLNLAGLLATNGRLPQAETAFRQALKIAPQLAEALIGLSDVLARQNRLDEAETVLRQAMQLGTAVAETHFCQGNIQAQRGLMEDARESYRSAIHAQPKFIRAYNNLGNVLLGLACVDEAIDCFREALEIAPDYADAHGNLGLAYLQANRFADAESCYRRALQLQPQRVDLLGQLGFVLRELGRTEEARAAYRELIRIHPGAAEARLAMSMLALPIVPHDAEEAGRAPERFGQALGELSGWLDADPAHRAAFAEVIGSTLPYHLAYRPGNHRDLLSRHGDLATGCLPAAAPPIPERCGKTRLLVVSNQVCRHSVWDVVLRGLLANIDRERFETILYHTGSHEDAETVSAQAMVDAWRDRRQLADFEALRRAVEADAPDAILYPEIGMDPFSFRLAAYRLAPLQIASWGHPITTGLSTIDLFLSGELLEAVDVSAHYREKLVRLPGAGCCTVPLDIPPEPIDDIIPLLPSRPGPRFVIAQRAFKADPSHDALYAEIAATTGNCTFILLRDPVYPWATERLCERLRGAFRQRGLDPANYLIEIPWLSAGKFVSLLNACDIFLDCPAFSGYTTAWQAAHGGLPIVTLEGESLRQRLAAGLLRKIGVTDTIASTPSEYVRIAAHLARETSNTAEWDVRRARLKELAPLSDGDMDVVRAFEQVVTDELAARQLGTI